MANHTKRKTGWFGRFGSRIARVRWRPSVPTGGRPFGLMPGEPAPQNPYTTRW